MRKATSRCKHRWRFLFCGDLTEQNVPEKWEFKVVRKIPVGSTKCLRTQLSQYVTSFVMQMNDSWIRVISCSASPPFAMHISDELLEVCTNALDFRRPSHNHFSKLWVFILRAHCWKKSGLNKLKMLSLNINFFEGCTLFSAVWSVSLLLKALFELMIKKHSHQNYFF